MRPAPVSRLVTVTVAPGRAAPEESSTLPETDAVTCALIVPTAKQMLKRTPAKACVDNFLSESILHPSPFGRNSLEELYSRCIAYWLTQEGRWHMVLRKEKVQIANSGLGKRVKQWRQSFSLATGRPSGDSFLACFLGYWQRVLSL